MNVDHLIKLLCHSKKCNWHSIAWKMIYLPKKVWEFQNTSNPTWNGGCENGTFRGKSLSEGEITIDTFQIVEYSRDEGVARCVKACFEGDHWRCHPLIWDLKCEHHKDLESVLGWNSTAINNQQSNHPMVTKWQLWKDIAPELHSRISLDIVQCKQRTICMSSLLTQGSNNNLSQQVIELVAYHCKSKVKLCLSKVDI